MNNNKEYTFFWFIENCSYCWHKSGEQLISPVFIANELQRTAWTLYLYPRGRDDKEREDGSTVSPGQYTANIAKGMSWGWPFLEMDEILSRRKAEYLPKDILTVRCKLSNSKENVEKVAPIYGRTRIGIGHIFFHHTVEGFSALEPNQKKTYQTHSPSQTGRVRSCMYVSDGSCCEEKLMVEITPSGSGQILAKCELYLLEASGKKTKCAEADNRFDAERKEIGKLPLSLTKDEIMNKKSEYLPVDKLSLLCECTFSTGIEFQRIEGIQNEITTTVGKLASDNPHIKYANISQKKLAVCPSVADDLKDIYNSKFLTDVELKTKTNSFPAHKNVLCARSPVFKVMMSNDMKEKNSDSIQVDDLEDGTAQQLLLFLYSDNVEDLQWETATKLFYAADKYQIEKLRLICSSFLIDNLTTSTATELLLLADTHSDSDLRKFVEDFILDHDEQVFGSEKWERLMEVNPQLALKTIHLKYKTKEVGK